MKVLVIAPHPDDEVLGCGGTIAKHASRGDEVYVCVVTKGCEPLFSREIVEQSRFECKKADNLLGVKETILWDFPAAMLEETKRYELNGKLIDLIQNIKPDIAYIPHRGDMQLDHKLVVDACMVAMRPKYEHTVSEIYSYEILSETGWDVPNVVNEFLPVMYINISDFLDVKIRAMKIFESQLGEYPNARSLKAVESLARFRGAISGVRAAEAFSVVRLIK